MRIVLFILGLLLLLNAALLSLVSNPTIGFVLQAILAIGLILYAVFFKRFSKKIHIIAGVICLIPLAFSSFLFFYGNVSNVDYTEDVVIVLGAGIHGEQVSRPLARRLDAAIAYWNRNPEAVIIVCGGLGNRATITEAEAMARYLLAFGIPEAQILLEDRSTSTYENLVFAKEILDEYFPEGFRAVVVTNDFHIYRAVRTARQAGIYPARLGASTAWYSWPVNYLREMLAVGNLWLFSRGNS